MRNAASLKSYLRAADALLRTLAYRKAADPAPRPGGAKAAARQAYLQLLAVGGRGKKQ